LSMAGHQGKARLFPLMLLLLALTASSAYAQAPLPSSDEKLLEIARQGMNLLMNGDPDAAILRFEDIRRKDPDSPLGYLFEADAYWWKIYLTTGNLIDPDVFDVVSKNTSPYDGTFESFAGAAIQKAEARIQAKQDLGRSLLEEGMTYGLWARYYGLRDNDLPTARAGKKMRALLLEALKVDPGLTDAYLGLGIYNYFVDTLPTIVKMLKFLIGLPGGNRELGLKQMETAARQGDLARGEAKFYLAKDYSRRSEQQYAKSLELFQELSAEYPKNLLWKLVIGSLQIRLGHAQEGEVIYREVLGASAGRRSEAEAAIHAQAQQALDRMHPRR
jgi:tetratricopeptide (TPR) repeat protein